VYVKLFFKARKYSTDAMYENGIGSESRRTKGTFHKAKVSIPQQLRESKARLVQHQRCLQTPVCQGLVKGRGGGVWIVIS